MLDAALVSNRNGFRRDPWVPSEVPSRGLRRPPRSPPGHAAPCAPFRARRESAAMRRPARCARPQVRRRPPMRRSSRPAAGARIVKSRRTSRISTEGGGLSTDRTASVSARTSSAIASACGVATMPRPAETSTGSPNAVRSRDKVRLMAEVLRPSCRAAADTLRSRSKASSATRRLRSRLPTAIFST